MDQLSLYVTLESTTGIMLAAAMLVGLVLGAILGRWLQRRRWRREREAIMGKLKKVMANAGVTPVSSNPTASLHLMLDSVSNAIEYLYEQELKFKTGARIIDSQEAQKTPK